MTFETYFLRKIRPGESKPLHDKIMLRELDIRKLRASVREKADA